MSAPLQGLRVLVTRPAHQADALCHDIEAAGGEAARLPLLGIEPVGDDTELRAQMDAWRDADAWIFTSRNAVDRAVALDLGRWPPLLAVGSATAQALIDAGRTDPIVPDAGFSSEGLLALPMLQNVEGQRFAIFTGEDARPVLEETLGERGAQTCTIALYRRRPMQYDAARVEAEIGMADAILVTSSSGLRQLRALTPESMQPVLLDRTLIVPSQRVRAEAVDAGFQQVLVPSDATDSAVLAALIGWRNPDVPIRPEIEPEQLPADDDLEVPPPRASVPDPEPAAGPVRAARGASLVPWLLVLLLLVALGAAGWLLWQQSVADRDSRSAQAMAVSETARQIDAMKSQLSQQANRISDASRTTQRNALDIATLTQRYDESTELMGRISEELQGGRTRYQMNGVEQLLVAANDRLQLEQDVSGALMALDIADKRLAKINEPRLFIVRQALAEERNALRSVGKVDLVQPSLRLGSLIASAERLPLKVDPRRNGHQRSRDSNADAAPGGGFWSRVGDAAGHVVDNLFDVRRVDDPMSLRLLPIEQQETLRQVLILRLETARLALLRGDSATLTGAVAAANDWLISYFDTESPAVTAAQEDLAQLQSLNLQPPLPDISRSLTLLRAQLEAGSP